MKFAIVIEVGALEEGAPIEERRRFGGDLARSLKGSPLARAFTAEVAVYAVESEDAYNVAVEGTDQTVTKRDLAVGEELSQ